MFRVKNYLSGVEDARELNWMDYRDEKGYDEDSNQKMASKFDTRVGTETPNKMQKIFGIGTDSGYGQWVFPGLVHIVGLLSFHVGNH